MLFVSFFPFLNSVGYVGYERKDAAPPRDNHLAANWQIDRPILSVRIAKNASFLVESRY